MEALGEGKNEGKMKRERDKTKVGIRKDGRKNGRNE